MSPHSGAFHGIEPATAVPASGDGGRSAAEDAIAGLLHQAETLLAAVSGVSAWDSRDHVADAVETARRDFGEDHPRTLEAMRLLAAVYNCQGRASQAISLAAKVVQSPAELDDWRRAHARTLLGAALLGQGARDEARKHLLAGHRLLAALAERIPQPERGCLDEARRDLAAAGTTASGHGQVVSRGC